ANGAISSLAACSSDINTNAQAPSFTPGAFPAVTVPSLSNAGFNFSNTSSVVPSRGASSVSTIIGSPRLCGTFTVQFLRQIYLKLLLLMLIYDFLQPIYLVLFAQ